MISVRSNFLVLMLAAAGAAIMHGAIVHRRAAAVHARAHETLRRTDADIAALLADRDRLPLWVRQQSAEPPGATPQLASRFSAALAAAGLPPTSLTSFSPERDTLMTSNPTLSTPGPSPPTFHAVRGRAAVSLSSVTLPRLGLLIDAWRTHEPDWRITAIEVSPDAIPQAAHSPGGDAPLRCLLTLESIAVSTTETSR